MKLGYSIILGEIVDAEQIEHGDCADGMIVCPSCSEPVFKVSASVRALGHLSHHRRDPDLDIVCERRVAAIGREEIVERNGISRGQTLEAFFALLEDMLQEFETEHLSDRALHRAVRRHKETRWIYEQIVKGMIAGSYVPDHLLSEVVLKMDMITTGRPIVDRFRREMVPDVIRLLFATPRGPATTRLLDDAVCLFIQRPEEDPRWASTSMQLRRATSTSRGKAIEIYRRMTAARAPGADGTDIQYVCWRLMNSMATILTILSYQKTASRLRDLVHLRPSGAIHQAIS